MLCAECKCCEAQASMADDPRPLCVFCEDGVPCPTRQRAARPAVTTSPAPITRLVQQKRGRPKNPNSPWRGMASLHLSDKAPEKPATTNGVAALQDEAKEPLQIDEVPTAGKDRQEEKETNMRLTDAERAQRKVCPCGTLLRKDNSDGLCKVCRKAARQAGEPLLKRTAKRGRPLKSKTTPPRNSSSRPASPRNGKDYTLEQPRAGIATICVTEAHMDNYWSKLTLEEKANLFQRQLEGV
jgi:hypothetical protein